MHEDEEVYPQPESSEEDRAARRLLSRLFPAIFEKAILEVEEEEERQNIARKFAHSPIISFEEIKDLLGYVSHVRYKEKRETDAEIMLKYAKFLLNTFLEERTEKAKNGISIQWLFRGEVIESLGHVLNEGVTEWFTLRVTDKMKKEGSLGTMADGESLDGAYLIEVGLIERLADKFGDQLIGRAYFGGIEELEELMNTVDSRLGRGAFIRLLKVTDAGDWGEAVAILNAE